MLKTLKLTNTQNEQVDITAKLLDESYLSQIMSLQNTIYSNLSDKSWYSCTSEEEFQESFLHNEKFLGCVTPDNELIAVGVCIKPNLNEYNLGFDIDLSKEDLLKVAHIESTIVREDFRGNRLQQLLCDTLEAIALENGSTIMMATVCPDNIYSLNTFLKLGYEIKKEKLKYGGLNRYILMKHL